MHFLSHFFVLHKQHFRFLQFERVRAGTLDQMLRCPAMAHIALLYRGGELRVSLRVARKVRLNLSQTFAVRFRQEDQCKQEAHNRDGREEPLNRVGASEKVGH